MVHFLSISAVFLAPAPGSQILIGPVTFLQSCQHIIDINMQTYTRDKKFREVQTEVRKKQKQTDESLMMGGEYVDAYRNISVAATGEKDLNKDLEDQGMSSKDKEATGPSAEMFHKLAKYQIK